VVHLPAIYTHSMSLMSWLSLYDKAQNLVEHYLEPELLVYHPPCTEPPRIHYFLQPIAYRIKYWKSRQKYSYDYTDVQPLLTRYSRN